MSIKVCKFGGTSMASGNVILSAAKIVRADKERRYVVVSAPGKRFGGDIKVTDLLYKCSDEYEAGNIAAFKETFTTLKTIIGSETSKELFLDDVLNNFWKEYSFL